ncbi:MAG: fliA [Candidatus Saccharibacteria bacterium]|nr:fliA [Candidatus Saccharibacteria bacterium]
MSSSPELLDSFNHEAVLDNVPGQGLSEELNDIDILDYLKKSGFDDPVLTLVDRALDRQPVTLQVLRQETWDIVKLSDLEYQRFASLLPDIRQDVVDHLKAVDIIAKWAVRGFGEKAHQQLILGEAAEQIPDEEPPTELEIYLNHKPTVEITVFKGGHLQKAFVAPQVELSDQETIDYFIQGEDLPSKLENLRALAANMRTELAHPNWFYEDDIMRSMVLLLRAHDVFKNSMPEADYIETALAITETFNTFFRQAQPLVASLIRSYVHMASSLTQQDLTAEGLDGLLESMARFDLGTTEAKVSTFCIYRIKGAAIDALRRTGNAIRLSRHDMQHMKKIKDAQATGVDLITVAEGLDIDIPKVQIIQARSNRAHTLSIHETVDSDRQAWDIPDTVSVEDEVLATAQAVDLENIVSMLPERQQMVTRMYFGLTPYESDYKLAEIGRQLGFTESRACQIVGGALKRLRSLAKIYEIL